MNGVSGLFHSPAFVERRALPRLTSATAPLDVVDLGRPQAVAAPRPQPAAPASTATPRPQPSPQGAASAPARASRRVPRTLLAETPTLLPVPDTRQCTTYSCGAAALQAVLMYWGIEYVESDLMARLNTDPQNGTNPRDIVRVAQEEGLQAELRENVTLDDLQKSVEDGCPVIIDCQAWRDGDDLSRPWKEVWDSGHYMVVIGMDDRNIYFEDPSLLGSRGFISRQEFEDRWHDVDEKKYVHGAIFIRGDKPAPPPGMVYVE
jgi:predicted double-glycine peptidase